jgi:hypothetical protein
MSSRSEKRFNKEITKLAETRDRFMHEGRLSLPSGLGKLAIIVSTSPDYRNKELTPAEQKVAFLEEGERLRQSLAPNHQQVILRRRAYPEEIKMDLNDPDVTDMILIGHGSIGNLWTDGYGGSFNWQDAVRNARSLLGNGHLKQGEFVQRMCGNFPLATVPLGTVVASDLRNIKAATGQRVPDIHPEESLFTPVYSSNENIVQQIYELNEQFKHQHEPKKR